MVDHAVLLHERAHARPVARVGRCVGPARGGEASDGLGDRGRLHGVAAALVIIFDASLALLLFRHRDVEIEVEVAGERRSPGKGPTHSPLIRLQLRERCPRHCRKRDVVICQMHDEAIEPVRDHRARRTARRVIGPEHEVIDQELRAPPEQLCQRGVPLIGFEPIFLVDPDPRQLLASPCEFVAAACELLFRLEQHELRRPPLVMGRRPVFRRHWSLPSAFVTLRAVVAARREID